MKPIKRSLLAGCVVLSQIAAAALAQARPVPTDHYGPPACKTQATASHLPSHESLAAAARTEQTRGLQDSHALLADEPLENFGVARYKLQAYGACEGSAGCYWADLDAQYKRAEAELAERVTAARAGANADARLAIVMDIDETTLSNYCELEAEDFGYIAPMFHAWIVSQQAAVAIPGALRLFHQAKAEHVAVFFITGRPGKQSDGATTTEIDQTPATARNLKAAGFDEWSGLILRNGTENGMATIAYKSQERQKIAAMGYKIIMSVGDQWSDLQGDPQAEVSVKLPNPFYFLP